MRKSIIVFMATCLLLGEYPLRACDVCGGGGGAGYGSIMPMFQQNMLGFRAQQSLFTHPAGINRNGESTVISDRYRQLDLWFRFRMADRLFLTSMLPLRENLRRETMQNSTLRGLGDARAELAWIALNTTDSAGRLWKHMLQFSAGFKLNNGKYMQRMANGVIAPLPLQTGSGAMGALMRGQYIVRRGRMGLQTDLQYTAFSTNEMNYRMGSQAAAGLRAFFWNYRGSRQYLFNAGLAAEYIARDLEFGAFKSESGGRFLHAQTEAVFFFGRYSLQCQASLPLMQELTLAQPAAGMRLGFGGAMFF